jgi:hypothetical protein
MKLAVMQPYFFPYIGYFQLINAADEFVVYDAIEYTKKGWINRNRILTNGTDAYISLALMKASDSLFVNDRQLADTWPSERKKILNRITETYRRAPEFQAVYPKIEAWLETSERNLFKFLYELLMKLLDLLEIETRVHISSGIGFDNSLKGEEKVLAIAGALGAAEYINPIGGQALYSRDTFLENGIRLRFLQSEEIVYPQFGDEFVPNLSIIDVLMFNPLARVRDYLDEYRLI